MQTLDPNYEMGCKPQCLHVSLFQVTVSYSPLAIWLQLLHRQAPEGHVFACICYKGMTSKRTRCAKRLGLLHRNLWKDTFCTNAIHKA